MVGIRQEGIRQPCGRGVRHPINRPRWLTGSAARGIQNQLGRLGFRIVAPPESFLVSSTTGPLLDGETERARSWGEKLGARLEAAERPSGS